MSAKHTPGLLHVDPKRSLRIATDQDESLASTGTSDVLRDSWEANARRLVACWNACEGVPTELLEAYPAPFTELRTQRDELLAALSRIAKWNEHTTEFAVDFGSNGVRDFYRGIASRAIRAIAKVKGVAA